MDGVRFAGVEQSCGLAYLSVGSCDFRVYHIATLHYRLKRLVDDASYTACVCSVLGTGGDLA